MEIPSEPKKFPPMKHGLGWWSENPQTFCPGNRVKASLYLYIWIECGQYVIMGWDGFVSWHIFVFFVPCISAYISKDKTLSSVGVISATAIINRLLHSPRLAVVWLTAVGVWHRASSILFSLLALLAILNIYWGESTVLECGLTCSFGIPGVFQMPLTVPCTALTVRKLLVVSAVQGDCETVYCNNKHILSSGWYSTKSANSSAADPNKIAGLDEHIVIYTTLARHCTQPETITLDVYCVLSIPVDYIFRFLLLTWCGVYLTL